MLVSELSRCWRVYFVTAGQSQASCFPCFQSSCRARLSGRWLQPVLNRQMIWWDEMWVVSVCMYALNHVQFNTTSQWVLYSCCPVSVKASFIDFSCGSSTAAEEIRFTPCGSHTFWMCLRTENRALRCFEVPKETLLSVKLTFCPPSHPHPFSVFLSSCRLWCGLSKSVLRRKKKERIQEERLLHDVLGEWGKKPCCFSDIVEVSERPERTQPWGGRRYRSPGSWMRGTGRWVSEFAIYLSLYLSIQFKLNKVKYCIILSCFFAYFTRCNCFLL